MRLNPRSIPSSSLRIVDPLDAVEYLDELESGYLVEPGGSGRVCLLALELEYLEEESLDELEWECLEGSLELEDLDELDLVCLEESLEVLELECLEASLSLELECLEESLDELELECLDASFGKPEDLEELELACFEDLSTPLKLATRSFDDVTFFTVTSDSTSLVHLLSSLDFTPLLSLVFEYLLSIFESGTFSFRREPRCTTLILSPGATLSKSSNCSDMGVGGTSLYAGCGYVSDCQVRMRLCVA